MRHVIPTGAMAELELTYDAARDAVRYSRSGAAATVTS